MRHRLVLITGIWVAAAAPLALAQNSSDKAPGDMSATHALFDQLDANGDGYLSREEASAAQPIADMYDSMDTNATMEQQAAHSNAGIDYAQFKAGIQAARSSGAFGPAASGGQTYLVYPDGHRELVKPGASNADRDSGNDSSH